MAFTQCLDLSESSSWRSLMDGRDLEWIHFLWLSKWGCQYVCLPAKTQKVYSQGLDEKWMFYFNIQHTLRSQESVGVGGGQSTSKAHLVLHQHCFLLALIDASGSPKGCKLKIQGRVIKNSQLLWKTCYN